MTGRQQPVNRRCFIFLFVLFKNIGELARERARTSGEGEKEISRGLYFITRGRRTLKRKQRVCEQARLGHQGNKIYCFPRDQSLSDVLCSWKLLPSDVLSFFALYPRSEILSGNSFIVRCHVTSEQPMRPRAVEKKFPAIKQSDCKDVSDYPKTSCDYYPNRHKASIYCLLVQTANTALSFSSLFAARQTSKSREERGQTTVFAGFYFSKNVKRWVGSLGTGARGG